MHKKDIAKKMSTAEKRGSALYKAMKKTDLYKQDVKAHKSFNKEHGTIEHRIDEMAKFKNSLHKK